MNCGREVETLRLLSRFAVFMWMEAEVIGDIVHAYGYADAEDAYRNSAWLLARRSTLMCRQVALGDAIERGLLRVTWRQP